MFSRIRRYAWAYVGFVQRILIAVLLFLLYFIGIGATRLYMAVFRRGQLRDDTGDSGTCWRSAEEYQPTAESCRQQS